ncbi:MAG: neutral zinc metallopeptidase, partial [Winkia neuii]|nr:neutral zinc metallopeptidase [Winkia neuii]
MSFNDNIQLDPGRVSTSKGGRGGRGLAIGGGGSLFVVIALVVISQLTGVDLIGGLTGGGQQ